jgi:hypothetical protein
MRMKIFTPHMILSGRILAILFILANSGFTAVLRQCTMKSDAPMECCSIPEKSDAASRDAVQKNATSPSIVSQFGCHTTTLVGGIASTSALLQKESAGQNAKASEFCAQLQQNTIITPTLDHSTNPAQLASNFSPPSVEKCVLNSSFLI